jgi:outer membrane protein
VKNLSLIWCALLTLAVGYLFYKNSGSGASAASSSSASPKTADGKSIVFVNTDSLIAKYDFFKDIQKEIDNKKYRLQVDLGTRERNLQNEYGALQQRAASMTQAEQQGAAIMLEKKKNEYVQYSQQAQGKLQEDAGKKNQEIFNRIHDYINKTNAENKYEFVLGYSKIGGGILLFADGSVDATKKIIDGLNADYKANKPAATPAKK